MDTETLATSVVIAKLLVDEIGENPTYESVIDIADSLDITVDQVFDFIRLYKQVQCQMMI